MKGSDREDFRLAKEQTLPLKTKRPQVVLESGIWLHHMTSLEVGWRGGRRVLGPSESEMRWWPPTDIHFLNAQIEDRVKTPQLRVQKYAPRTSQIGENFPRKLGFGYNCQWKAQTCRQAAACAIITQPRPLDVTSTR